MQKLQKCVQHQQLNWFCQSFIDNGSNFKSNFSKRSQWCIVCQCVLFLFLFFFSFFFSKARDSGHNNICFHSGIFGGIRIFVPGSWRMGVHVGGTRPLISFSQHLPLTSQYPIWGWPGLRESRGEGWLGVTMRERQWGVLKVVGGGLEWGGGGLSGLNSGD